MRVRRMFEFVVHSVFSLLCRYKGINSTSNQKNMFSAFFLFTQNACETRNILVTFKHILVIYFSASMQKKVLWNRVFHMLCVKFREIWIFFILPYKEWMNRFTNPLYKWLRIRIPNNEKVDEIISSNKSVDKPRNSPDKRTH